MVYIVNNKGQNFEAAEKYGELKNITSGTQPIFNTAELKKRIKRGLADFDPEKDYILCVGPSWLLMIVASYLANKPVKYLVFDAINQSYILQNLGGM